jgi:two-component system nitrate/nitrite response regulator NarL
MNAPVRILVVDDHTLFRRGLTALLARDNSLQVVGDAADAGEAQRRAAELQPDLILLDNHLPGVNGVDALPALHQAAPAARIMMLTVSEDEADLAAALRAGACGYLLKTIEGDALLTAIQRAMRGASVVAEEMTGKLVAATAAPRPHLWTTTQRHPRPRPSNSCRRASATSCAASRAAPATRRSHAIWASPRPR